ncbi:MAG: FliH/SctL family protein [Propionibacteriales bacterium]|nr:FliH/SctL family protein [Propionibacteriales bacterium]
MSSSPEPRTETWDVAVVPLPELRTGAWTRFGNSAVLGDAITEQTLSALAESTRVAAGSQGYAVGWAEGQRAARAAAQVEAAAVAEADAQAEARRGAEHAAAVAALNEATRQLHQAVTEVCATLESQASELAWELTQELVGHEVSGPGIDVVRRVLALTPTENILRVRLHPADLGRAADELGDLLVVGDPTLDRGDALVEIDDHVLDLRLQPALQRVREALR